MIQKIFLKLSRWYLCKINSSSKARDFIMWPLTSRIFGKNYQEVINLKNGLKMKTDLGDMLGRLVIFYGLDLNYFWEPQTAKLMEKLIADAECAMDAGSHIGYLALLARRAMKNPNSILHSFEPVAYLYNIARENFALNNNSEKIIINQMALSDHNGEAEVSIDNLRSAIVSDGDDIIQNKEKVRTITVDDYLHQVKLPRLDFLLLDVEGYEPKVFAGMAETMRHNQPQDIIFEYSTKIKGGIKAWHEYIAPLAPFGYNFYYIRDNYTLDNIKEDWGKVELAPVVANLSELTVANYCNILATKRSAEELKDFNIVIK